MENAKEGQQDKVYYVSDKNQQSQYITLFKENGLNAVYLTHPIDVHFIPQMEAQNENLTFNRIDSDISGALGEDEADKTNEESLTSLFKDVLSNEHLQLSIENLKSDTTPSMVVISEQGRRMQEMMKLHGMEMASLAPQDITLVLNQNHKLIKSLSDDNISSTTKDLICKHLYDLALISNQTLSATAMKEFLNRNNELLLNLIK